MASWTYFPLHYRRQSRGVLSRQICLCLFLAGIVFMVLFVVLPRLVFFINIFNGRHSGIRITQKEVLAAYNEGGNNGRQQVVPKIIHQIFHNWKEPGNENLPPDWATMRETCVRENPDWDVKLWTDNSSREFLAAEYPTFLKTYDSYKYPVQRVDALRYFLMLHYGGIYIDLDNGCKTSLEPLLYYPVWLADGAMGALSNDVLGAKPNHPFWQLVTQKLESYNWNYVLPYIIISYASGQWFITDMWERYHHALPLFPTGDVNYPSGQNNKLYQLNTDERPEADPSVFFTHGRGGSWDHWDNKFFGWLGNRPEQSIPTLIALVIIVCARVWYVRKSRARRRTTETY